MSATGMNGTKWKLLFFAPVLQISRTDDWTKANIYELKRIAIVHAKFALTENRHYFAHLPHNGFGDALFARNYCAYNGMAFRTSDNVYNCVILTRHYCACNGMAFVSRNTRYDAGDFAYRYCGFGDADFAARYCAFDRGIFRAIISIILVFTCNQVQFI